MKLLDPVTIPTDSSGNPLPFSIPLPVANRPAAIKLSNQSPWLQGVRLSGFTDWLDAFTADVYPVPKDAFQVDLAPRAIIVPQPTVLSAFVLPVLAYPGEQFAGTYPMALPRQSATYGKQTVIGSIVTTGDGVNHCKTFTVPAGTQSVAYRITAGNGTFASMLGLTSNINWILLNPSAVGKFAALPFLEGDQQVQCCFTDTGVASSIDFLASPQSATTWVQGLPGTFLPTHLFNNNNQIITSQSDPAPHNGMDVSTEMRPYDATADSGEPASGVVATATVGGVSGKRQTCGMVRGEIAGQVGVAASVVRLRLRDGASGAGAILQSWVLGIPATAGANALLELSGLAIRGTSGNAMTVEFSGAIANGFEACGLGVWQD